MRFDSRVAPAQTEIETIDGRRVALKLVVNPRARRVSVRIDPTRREAIATAPSSRQLKLAVRFAAERAGWIAHELERLPQGVLLAPGALAPLRGVLHELVYEYGRTPARIGAGAPHPRLVAPAPDLALFESRLLRFFKEEARADLHAAVARHAAVLGVRAARLQVKELRSRWGSCSADGVLSFSWRIVLAPPHVLEYLAAHEVAHLKEMNHSRRFWVLVRQCMPDFERGREWLHQHGCALHAVARAR
ncbi:MAG: SprT family zinc-dependent metalloprotease [Terricaulis sp.]